MCGRVRLSSDVSEIKLVFLDPTVIDRRRTSHPVGTWPPTDLLPIVRYDRESW